MPVPSSEKDNPVGGPDETQTSNDSVNDTTRKLLRDEVIKIDPVSLDPDELQYELYARGSMLSGTNRDRTGRLEKALKEERRSRSPPNRSPMLLSHDVAQTVLKLAVVNRLLGTLTFQEAPIKRIGSLLAHLEGRVTRMYPETPEHGAAVRDLRSQVEGFIQMTLDTLEILEDQKRRRPKGIFISKSSEEPRIVDVTDEDGESVSETVKNTQLNAGKVKEDSSDIVVKTIPAIGTTAQANQDKMTFVEAGSRDPSATFSLGEMPSEAVFSAFPLVSTLSSEQMRALDKSFDSGLDGRTFLEAWSSHNGAHSTQHYGSESTSAVPRNVHFQEDGDSFPRRENTSRDFWDTPLIQHGHRISSIQPVPIGRFSDASSGHAGGSVQSNRNQDGGSAHSIRSIETSRGYTPAASQMQHVRPTAAPPANLEAERNATHHPPGNETYVVNTRVRHEHNRTGQYIFVPDDAPEDAAQNLSGGVTGKYVFIPYDDPDPWRLMRNEKNENRRASTQSAPPTRTRSVVPDMANRSSNGGSFSVERESTPSSFTRLRSRIQPIYDWNLNFSGEEKLTSPNDLRINEFLYQIEINKHARQISDEEMLGQISSLLTGPARTWYYAYYRSFRDWGHFVESMRRRFLSQYHELDALDEISQRKQGKTESVMAYLNQMVMLFQTVSENLSEQYMAHVIQRNLRPEFQALVGPWEPKNLAELERVLRKLQPTKMHIVPEAEKRPFFRRVAVPRVNEIETNSETPEEEVIQITEEEINAILRDRRTKNSTTATKRNGVASNNDGSSQTLVSVSAGPSTKAGETVCYNCNEKGHYIRECTRPKKGIHCYLCKKEGVRSTECNCSKNSASCLSRQPEESESDSGNQAQ